MKFPEKVFWFDLETSGVNEHENGIAQLVAKAEIDSEVEGEIELLIEPGPGLVVEQDALEVTGFTEQELRNEHDQEDEAFAELKDFMDRYIDPYDSSEKFWVGGYNVDFDIRFLTEFWNRNKGPNDYLGSYIMRNRKIDPYGFASALTAIGRIDELDDAKLQTVAPHVLDLDEDVDWHDAATDIEITRRLAKHLLSRVDEAFVGSSVVGFLEEPDSIPF